MVLTPKQVGPIVDRMYQRLSKRRPEALKSMRYFRGEQGMLVYATDEFREASRGRYEGFSDNWCAPVATAGAERTAVRGVKLPGGDLARPSADENRLWTALQDNDFDAQMAMAFLQAPIQQRAFVSVWAHRDGPDAGKPLVAAESATQAIVEYDPEVRWQRRFGVGDPVVRVVWDLCEPDRRLYAHMQDRGEQLLRQMGADRIGRGPIETGVGCCHDLGGARSGIDPTRSVVDPSWQVHDTPGLHVYSGATFPTCPGINPTLTIWAWALRNADQLARSLGASA